MRYEYHIYDIDCHSCALELEDKIRRIPNIDKANINFLTEKLIVETSFLTEEINQNIFEIVKKNEPDAKLIPINNKVKKINTDNKSNYIQWGRVTFAFILYIIAFLINNKNLSTNLFLISYIVAGYKVLIDAFKGILAKDPFNEDFLMSLASAGAFAIGEYPEATAVMLFYLVGESFQDAAVDKSRKSIQSLLDMKPENANLLIDGEVKEISAEAVNIGDIILIRPGERVPLDGIVIKGNSSIDVSMLTGESIPMSAKENSKLLSGSIVNDGVIEMKVSKIFSESTFSKIMELVEHASENKAPTEQFITKFARYYTPVVVFAALFLTTIPPLLFNGDFQTWLYRALVFLVVSCPCALVVSVPLGFFGGIGKASKNGILIKGGNYLEALVQLNTVIFDKTGTLTKGEFKVQKIETVANITKDELSLLAASVEIHSNHPIAISISKLHKNNELYKAKNIREIPGRGIIADINDSIIYAGSAPHLKDNGIEVKQNNEIGTVVYIGRDNEYLGYFLIMDEIKSDAKESIKKFKNSGVKTVLLTGDRREFGNYIGNKLGLDEVHSELLPQDKVKILEEYENKKEGKESIAFIGDGINDAPVIARADIGMAMGALGSDAAIEAADIVLMTDEPLKSYKAYKIGKETRKIVMQNIILSLGVKALVLGLSIFGLATMWGAVLADVGVAFIAIINSIRLLR